jgi:hypothetical protein
MKYPPRDLQVICDQMFRRWCIDEMVDMRMVDVLEDAFINGFLSRHALDQVQQAKQLELPPERAA